MINVDVLNDKVKCFKIILSLLLIRNWVGFKVVYNLGFNLMVCVSLILFILEFLEKKIVF